MEVKKMTNCPKPLQAHPVYNKIWHDTHTHDRHSIILITGKPGSGKSTAGVRFLYNLDRGENSQPRFKPERVARSPREFIELLEKKMPKGSGILWDEVGVDVPKKEWYSLKNRVIIKVAQTMRFKNRILVLTVPSMGYLDKDIKPLVDGLLVMKEHNTFTDKYSYGSFYWVQYNSRYDKFYYKYPVTFENGVRVQWNCFKFKMPPKDWVVEYKKREREAKQKLLASAKGEISFMEQLVGKGQNWSVKSLRDKVMDDLDDYLDAKGKKVMSAKILASFDGIDRHLAGPVAAAINDDIKQGKVAL